MVNTVQVAKYKVLFINWSSKKPKFMVAKTKWSLNQRSLNPAGTL